MHNFPLSWHARSLALAIFLAPVLGCTEQSEITQPGTTFSSPDFTRASEGSVSGHIERDFTELGVPVEKFSFHARYLGNGQVEGDFQLLDFFLGGYKEVVRGRVTCFTVESDGKTARIGGITEAATNQVNIGFDAVWTVVDNGEGANSPPDQSTDLRYGVTLPPGSAAAHCEVGFPPEAFGTFGTSVRGNVQVRR
jgi:hypothetical protein